jgi:hypothetical protein
MLINKPLLSAVLGILLCVNTISLKALPAQPRTVHTLSPELIMASKGFINHFANACKNKPSSNFFTQKTMPHNSQQQELEYARQFLDYLLAGKLNDAEDIFFEAAKIDLALRIHPAEQNIEEAFNRLNSAFGSWQTIRELSPLKMFDAFGLIEIDANINIEMLFPKIASFFHTVKTLHGNDPELWEIIKKAYEGYRNIFWGMHPKVKNAGLYYNPESLERSGITLTRSAVYHEVIEVLCFENNNIDPAFLTYFRHFHPVVILGEFRFALLSGELEYLLTARQEEIDWVRSNLDKVPADHKKIVLSRVKQMDNMISEFEQILAFSSAIEQSL